MRHQIKTVIIIICMILSLSAQLFGGSPDSINSKPLLVPFEIERDRIIIPTRVNDSKELDIILDTGMRFDGIYLFHNNLVNDIDMTDAINVEVPGAGSGNASTATMIETGRITFGDVSIDSQKVIISNSPHTQNFPTDGVIGWNLFGHYTVEINYDFKLITLQEPSNFAIDSSWSMVPITLKKDIPFLECYVETIEDEITPVSLYIDLASGDVLELLTKPDQKFSMPVNLEDSYLGTGLSGDIHGQTGTCKSLRIASFKLIDIPTSIAPAKVRSKQEGADGILGNGCIKRFNVIFDYKNKWLYLKPNSVFNESFNQ